MKLRLKILFSFSFIQLFISSCAGYRFNTQSNPLISYNIRSLSVPMFVNRSVFPNLHTYVTKEIIFALNDYSGLSIESGDDASSDAVLIGLVESRNNLHSVIKNTNELFTDDDKDIKKTIRNRTPFYYPIANKYDYQIKIFLIKRPTEKEREMLLSTPDEVLRAHPKIVLVDTFEVAGSFSRVIGENTSINSSGKVNFVKNKGILDKSLQDSAATAAKTFKQVVLNAF